MTRIYTSLLGLATLAALGLAAVQLFGAQATRAQTLTLNSGDNVTVSAAGTHGTVGGQPINNATTSYSNPGETVLTMGTAALPWARAAPSPPPGSTATRSTFSVPAPSP